MTRGWKSAQVGQEQKQDQYWCCTNVMTSKADEGEKGEELEFVPLEGLSSSQLAWKDGIDATRARASKRNSTLRIAPLTLAGRAGLRYCGSHCLVQALAIVGRILLACSRYQVLGVAP